MLSYRYPFIAREGWVWIAAVFVVAIVVQHSFGGFSIPLWILVVILLYLFRDPIRKIPAAPLGIVCPVDGRVVAIENVNDGYLDRRAICVSVKMSMTSVYSVHSPMEGKIKGHWLDTTRKIRADVTENSHLPAITDTLTNAQWIQSDEGDDLVMVMESGTPITQPRCYAQSGERIGQGQRCGYLRFGAQVDVLLPASTRITVNIGDEVIGGSDLIGSLVRETPVQQAFTKTAET
jgi:phosphatidylserine decarboxylase